MHFAALKQRGLVCLQSLLELELTLWLLREWTNENEEEMEVRDKFSYE